jgi:RNA polymerase sigma factor (TIGR02999 family)
VPLGGFRESTVAEAPTEQITQLLRDWSQGDQRALDALGPLVYQYLHRIAQNHMRRERPGHTLQATALVHEAYLRPVDRRAEWKNRAHFFAIAAQMMRRILVDHAKAEHSAKRGAGAPRVSLDEPLEISREPALDLVRLNDNLAGLAGSTRSVARSWNSDFSAAFPTKRARRCWASRPPPSNASGRAHEPGSTTR